MLKEVKVIGEMKFPTDFVFGDMEDAAQEVWLKELSKIEELITEYVLEWVETEEGCVPHYNAEEYIEVTGKHPEMLRNWETNTDVIYVQYRDYDSKGWFRFDPQIIDGKCMYVFVNDYFE